MLRPPRGLVLLVLVAVGGREEEGAPAMGTGRLFRHIMVVMQCDLGGWSI